MVVESEGGRVFVDVNGGDDEVGEAGFVGDEREKGDG